jgi:alanyl-tRNA synthetase
LVGADAYRFLARENLIVSSLTALMKARPEELPDRVASLMERLKSAERELSRVRTEQLQAGASTLVEGARDIAGVKVAAFQAPEGTSGADLRQVALDVRARLGDGAPAVVVALAADGDTKVSAIAATNAGARDRGLSARGLLEAALAAVGGRGGGKDDVAQGGGTDPSGIPQALSAVAAAVQDAVG